MVTDSSESLYREYVLKEVEFTHSSAVDEVRVLASLRHPFIVSFREAFETHTLPKRLCIVMQFADQGDLAGKIKLVKASPSPRLCVSFSIRCLSQISLALEYMHRKGIIYRDLKPSNVLLRSADRVVLADFGISRVLENETFACTHLATPFYMSPEQSLGRPHTTAADIWALGVLIFEMSTLRVPFEGGTLKNLLSRIATAPIPPLPNNCNADLRKLYGQCMQRDFTKRPSAGEVLKNSTLRLAMLQLADQLKALF